MSRSGMKVSHKTRNVFGDMQLAKQSGAFLLLTSNRGSGFIEIAEQGVATSKDDFVSHLPSNACRHAIYDTGAKLIYFMWVPDDSPVQDRMTTSSTKESVITASPRISFSYEVHSQDEVLEKLSKH
ncbi:hypothetical protein [Nocardia sp. NPDC051570]|uniref:hypothetical protein n=1 Tax=Nocardia sp. NPDC051570 TaxID=3364324 RepID=UPI00379A8DEE